MFTERGRPRERTGLDVPTGTPCAEGFCDRVVCDVTVQPFENGVSEGGVSNGSIAVSKAQGFTKNVPPLGYQYKSLSCVGWQARLLVLSLNTPPTFSGDVSATLVPLDRGE